MGVALRVFGDVSSVRRALLKNSGSSRLHLRMVRVGPGFRLLAKSAFCGGTLSKSVGSSSHWGVLIFALLLMLGGFAWPGIAWGALATLSNGTGDGTVTVVVDPYGSFGYSTPAGDALFDPAGPVGPSRTVWESGLYFSPLGNFLTTDSFGAQLPRQRATEDRSLSLEAHRCSCQLGGQCADASYIGWEPNMRGSKKNNRGLLEFPVGEAAGPRRTEVAGSVGSIRGYGHVAWTTAGSNGGGILAWRVRAPALR